MSFANYLKFQKKSSEKKSVSSLTLEQKEFISTPKHEHNIKIVTNSGYLWDTLQKEAIEKGNLIHNIMSQIKTKTDNTTIRNYSKKHIYVHVQYSEIHNIKI